MLILDPTKMLQGLVVCQACLVARVYFKQYFLEGVLILRAESYSVTRVQMKVFWLTDYMACDYVKIMMIRSSENSKLSVLIPFLVLEMHFWKCFYLQLF